MSVINILSPHVADLIAAGEVVDRPASVVKELVENSVDAGARSISIEIEHGGMKMIRITDDGCGMSPEDAGTAFLRHATSKLHDEKGLECISTLGFRGEALAAISAVSHITLKTRLRGTGEGVRVCLSGGDIEEMTPDGCREGAVMEVRDLFFNTPARLKFVKSDRAEASACCSAALRCALAHPEVSMRLYRDGEEVFFTPGDGRVKSAVYALLGREAAASMLEVSGENGGVRVYGYVSAPHAGRGNRAMQFFFVNDRPFKSASIQAALEGAYKNTLLTGRFPACALYISLGFGSVDVNVHPAKTEVKFSDEKLVFDCVYGAVRSALEKEREPAHFSPAVPAAPPARPAGPVASGASDGEASYRSLAPADIRPTYDTEYERTPVPNPERCTFRAPETAYAASPIVPRPVIPGFDAAPRRCETPVRVSPAASEAAPSPAASEACTPAAAFEPDAQESAPPVPFRLIGETMDAYILVETEAGLLLIDKHAAHERIIFDRLLRQEHHVMSQTLLVPVTVTPRGDDAELIEQNGALLSECGFEIERYGAHSLIIRAVPEGTDFGGEEAMLEEICAKLRRGGSPDDRRAEILHTVACKAAIKAGWKTEPEELSAVAARVVSGEVKYCPHGRPVSVLLTRKELDRQFKRIV